MGIFNGWFSGGTTGGAGSSGTSVTIGGNNTGQSTSNSAIINPQGLGTLNPYPHWTSGHTCPDPAELKRLEDLEKEYIQQVKAARVAAFRALPADIRAELVRERQLYDAESSVENAQNNAQISAELRLLRGKVGIFSQHNNPFSLPGLNNLGYGVYCGGDQESATRCPRDLGLTTQELERAHLDQCAEEMLTCAK